jgi:hypothetical protein
MIITLKLYIFKPITDTGDNINNDEYSKCTHYTY